MSDVPPADSAAHRHRRDIVRQSPDLDFVDYGDPSAPEGLDRAAFVYADPSHLHTDAQLRPFFEDRPTSAPRSLTAAVVLTLVLPGAGHWYLGSRRAGGAFIVTTVMLAIAGATTAGPALTTLFLLNYVTATVLVIVSARRLVS